MPVIQVSTLNIEQDIRENIESVIPDSVRDKIEEYGCIGEICEAAKEAILDRKLLIESPDSKKVDKELKTLEHLMGGTNHV